MELKQSHVLSQKLALTQTMRQSLDCLQLSAPELCEYVQDVALSNPLLDVCMPTYYETELPNEDMRSEYEQIELRSEETMIGGRAYSMHDEKRLPLFLLNNLLGGPGMNNRLNVSLREKNGLVYNVESNVTSYTDTGLASIYFGTDPKNKEKAIRLVYKELAKLREVKLTATQLAAAKKQVIGQLGVSGDNREGLFLGLGKSFLHYNR